MKHSEKLLSEMNNLLDLLIINAKLLLNAAEEMSKDQLLISLQDEQNKLLDQLIKKDELLREYYINIPTSTCFTMRQKVDNKLDTFQELNEKFIHKTQEK